MIAIIAIIGIVGLVWAAVLFRHGDLIAGCLAVLLVGSVFGHAFFHVSVITADRLLLVGLVGSYFIYRCLGLADPKPLDKADLAVFFLMVVLTISTFSHHWRLHGAKPLATLIFFHGLPVVLYWIGRQAKLTERSLLTIFAFLAVFGVYLGLTAIAETRNLWSCVFPRYIVSSEYDEFLGRGRGPFLNPVGCGLYLSAGLFGVVQWWPRWGRFGRMAILGLAGVMLLGAYCTLTRSVWLGTGLGLVLIVWLAIRPAWRIPLAVFLVVAVSAVWMLTGDKLNAFKRDKHISVREMSESAKLRPILTAVAWKMFLDRPLFGCGFGQYKQHDIEYLQLVVGDLDLNKARPYVQHNVFLAVLTQTGLLGLGLWLIVLGLWSNNAWRVWRNRQAPLWARQYCLMFLALVVAYCVNGLFHDVSIISMTHMLLFFLAGVSQGLVPHIHARRETRRSPALPDAWRMQVARA